MRKVKEFVLHKNPDLDCLGALWLMKRFGAKEFEGAESAPVQYRAIDEVNGPVLAKQEIIALDIGGGDFDHHNLRSGQENLCAAVLVARHLKIADQADLKKFLELIQRKDVKGEGIKSKDTLDQVFHLTRIMDDLNRLYPNEPEQICRTMFEIFDAHYCSENEWCALLQQLEQAFFVTTKEMQRVVLIYSDSHQASRASRYKKFDACVIKNTTAQSVAIQWSNPLHGVVQKRRERIITNTARQLRLLENRSDPQNLNSNDFSRIGNCSGWFLHNSLNLLLYGSPKNAPSQPSHIPDQIIVQMVACSLDETSPFPEYFCRHKNCTQECNFYSFDFPNCRQFKKGGSL